MHVVMIDDSVPLNGATPAEQSLGGAERAFVALARALARRRHDVSAITRCADVRSIDGVTWLPFELPRPPKADVLIAFRRPSLLGEVDGVERKVLWLANPVKYLGKPSNQALLDRHRPVLVFLGDRHRRSFSSWRDFREVIIPPGVGAPFTGESGIARAEPAEAVFTAHPARGLTEMVDLWSARVHPYAPHARLRVFSAVLHKAGRTGEVPEELAAVHRVVKAAEDKGVVVERPGGEAEMAVAYRRARAHLYPRGEAEVYPWTLAESQACGCPAVAFPGGAADERVRNGQTGYLVPDNAAFANLTLEMLRGGGAFESLSRDAATLQGRRGWDVAAAEFDALWAR